MAESEPCEDCKKPYRTIDDCYNHVLQRLTAQGKIKEVSARLILVKTNHEKVLYCYKILKDLDSLPILKKNSKNTEVAVCHRLRGNQYFKHKKFFEAWQAYNLSLLYADHKTEHFILAISNRSAVFFGMEKYEECLRDIEFIFSKQYPENLQEKLMRRKKECEAKINAAKNKTEDEKGKDLINKKISEILTVKGPKDKKYVSASTKLKVMYTEEMGRHVIANEDINVGEVLVQEDPYLVVLLKPQFLFTCAHCLSRTMNLYPCNACVYTLYCSIECRETAYKKYHMIECGLLPSIVSMEFTKLEWLALRIMLKSRTDHNNWFEMFQTAEKAESRMNTDLWGCVKVGDKWVYDSQYYASIHTLATNVEKRTVSDLFRKCITAAVLMHLLTLMRFLWSDNLEIGRKYAQYVAGTLLRHIMTSPTNMHGISTMIENAEGKYSDEYDMASGAYAFLSLLNHSCCPNVVRYSTIGSGQMLLLALRPIKKGMQIFDNYGYHHAVQDRKTRQANLRFQYKFTCTCEACVDDWPMHAVLPDAKGLPESIQQKKRECLSAEVIENLMKGDKATAVKFYQPLCELIEVINPFAPCRELAECQEALKQCMAIFEGLVPFGYTKTIEWGAFPSCHDAGGPPHSTLGEAMTGDPLDDAILGF